MFAALTAVLAKLGIKGVSSGLAMATRTAAILVVAQGLVFTRDNPADSFTLQLFLVLLGMATGLSWLCHFRALQLGKVSQVAPVDKLREALAILLSVVFLGKILTLKAALGAALIIGGTLEFIF